MTAGNRNLDIKTSYYSSHMGGETWEGVEQRRVWSGGDSPRTHIGWNSYFLSTYWYERSKYGWHYYVPGVVDVWKWGPFASTYRAKTIVSAPEIPDSDLVSKVGSVLRGHDFNALVAMGEGKETVALITTSIVRIAKALRAVKGGNIPLAAAILAPMTPTASTYRLVPKTKGRTTVRKNRSLLGHKRPSLHKSWLELQYGWKPLLSDIYEAHKAFFDRTNVPRVQYARSSITTRGSKLNDAPLDYSAWSDTRKRSVIVKLTEKHSAWQDMGLTDPASLAWEMLPFSFVADWFIPIGTYLEARSFVNGSIGEIAFTELCRQSYTVDNKSLKTADNLVTVFGNESRKSVSYSRSGFTNLASYKLPLPGFKPLVKSLSLGHCLNAIALIRGLTQ